MKKLFMLWSLVMLVGVAAFHIRAGEGETPAAETDSTSVTIYYDNSNTRWSQVNIHYWDSPNTTWPGTPMTKVEGTDNIWSYTWTADPSTLKGFLFCNGIANGGDQTGDYMNVPADGHLYIGHGNKGSVIDNGIYNSNPDHNPDPEPDPSIPDAFKQYSVVLHLKDASWGTPNIYAWHNANGADTEITSTWPGDAMTKIEGHDGYWGWRNKSALSPTDLIFNYGSAQTDNLEWTYGKIWVLYNAKNLGTEGTYEPETTSPSLIGKVINLEETEHGATIISENGTTELTLFGEGVVKVMQKLETVNTGERESVTVNALPSGSFQSISGIDEEDSSKIELSTSQLTITVTKSNTAISFHNAEGDSTGEAVLTQDNNYNVPGDIWFSFAAPGTSAFYGGGYVADANVAGKAITMNHTQTGGWPNSNASYNHNVSLPFVTSPKGFGVLFDDHYLNSVMTPGVGSLTYKSGSHNPVSYYFVAGGDMENVLANYADLTGHQPLPPFWSMGYITSRFGYESRDQAENVIKNIRGVDIPLDGIVFDIYWQGPSHSDAPAQAMGRLAWDETHFPNPKEMLSNFLNGFTKDGTEVKGGVNTILITEPYFSHRGGLANYQEMKDRGFMFADNCPGMEWIGNGALIEVTKPEALDWMNGKVYTNDDFTDVTGWWLDLGEPEHFLDNPSNANAMHKNGDTHAQVHNEYGLRWLEGAYNGVAQKYPERRHMLMPRSGTSGMQRYAAFPWTGDICRSWDGLRVQIPALISSGMAGVAYLGSDIGGFQNASGSGNIPEMYLRWMQFGAFSPMLRTHTDVPWHPQNVAEPYEAAYREVLNEVREAIRLRYSLLPYAYTMSYENATAGSPLARPMAYYDSENAALYNCADQYYWGKDILVAPVVTPSNGDTNWGPSSKSRSITFPEAGEKWIDLNASKNYEVHQGGTTVSNYDAPLNVIPHFARYNSIIPTYDASTCTSTSDIDRDNIIMTAYTFVNEGDKATGYYFDDDHMSATSLSRGKYNIVEVTVENIEDEYKVSILTPKVGYNPSAARERAAGYAADKPQTVTLKLPMFTATLPDEYGATNESMRLEGCASKSDFDNASVADGTAYFYQDPETKAVEIKFPVSRTSTTDEALTFGHNLTTGVSDIVIDPRTLMMDVCTTPGAIEVRATLPAGALDARVELYDMLGAVVATQSLNASDRDAVAAFSGLAPGVYIARLAAKTAKGNAAATAKAIVR